MAEISPTPWTVDSYGLPDPDRYPFVIADASGNTVALVSNRRNVTREFESVIPGHREAREAETEANANVLGAASALLTACEAMLARFGGSTLAQDQEALNMAREAVTQARGQ